MAVRHRSKSVGAGLAYGPYIGCTSAVSDVQRPCSCSCRLWRYISVMLTFLSLYGELLNALCYRITVGCGIRSRSHDRWWRRRRRWTKAVRRIVNGGGGGALDVGGVVTGLRTGDAVVHRRQVLLQNFARNRLAVRRRQPTLFAQRSYKFALIRPKRSENDHRQ